MKKKGMRIKCEFDWAKCVSFPGAENEKACMWNLGQERRERLGCSLVVGHHAYSIMHGGGATLMNASQERMMWNCE